MRKYFGTDGIRGKVGQFPITADFALKLGWATGQVLAQDKQGTVLIGHDARSSGYMLAAGLTAGCTAAGLDVCFLGTMPTPAVSYLTKALKAQIGVVVSASHNPYHDNGFKFFSRDGRKLPDAIESEIEAYLEKSFEMVSGNKIGQQVHFQNATRHYIEFCKHSFSNRLDLQGMKIVVDCANGAMSDIAPQVLSELGAQLVVLKNEPNGSNINEKCGATYPTYLQAEVIKHQAELGIAFDGDGDRLILVDHKGEVVDGDEILFILAMHLKDKLQGGVVGTLMSNYGLELALQEKKIPFIRAKVGDRYVLDQLIENDWRLGGENSGHIICMDQASTGDGLVAALQICKVLRETNESLYDLKRGMTKFPQILKNIRVENSQYIMSDPMVQNRLIELESSLQNKGRILVRPSGTEPLLRVMVEGQDIEYVNLIAEQMVLAIEVSSNTIVRDISNGVA